MPRKSDAEIKAEVERQWQEHWLPLLTDEQGNLDLEKVKAELHDYGFVLDQAAEVYSHITNGQMTKPTYHARDVIAVAEDYSNQLCDEATEEILKAERKAWQDDLGSGESDV